jgi:hypothetical protein
MAKREGQIGPIRLTGENVEVGSADTTSINFD